MTLIHLFISAGHNYFGHHGKAPDAHTMNAVAEIECVQNRGIRGDRFFDHKENYRGQITFFADEMHQTLRDKLGIEKQASVFRRNVITRGIDLNSLVGVEFEIQGVRFLGTEECKPCYWMNLAFGPGAEDALKGHGGLRAQILSTGVLKRGEGLFDVVEAGHAHAA